MRSVAIYVTLTVYTCFHTNTISGINITSVNATDTDGKLETAMRNDDIDTSKAFLNATNKNEESETDMKINDTFKAFSNATNEDGESETDLRTDGTFKAFLNATNKNGESETDMKTNDTFKAFSNATNEDEESEIDIRTDDIFKAFLNATNNNKESAKVMRTSGVFDVFLANYFFTLVNFRDPELSDENHKRRKKYLQQLYKCVENMKYYYTRKFAKKIKKLSRKNEEEIKEKLEEYKSELEYERPHRAKFLNAMNSIFWTADNVRFGDYIYELGEFGTLRKVLIEDETDRLLRMIDNRIRKLSKHDRNTLKSLMKKAIKEYSSQSLSSDSVSVEFSSPESEESSDSSSSHRRTRKPSSSSSERKIKDLSTSDYSFETWAKKGKQKLRAVYTYP